MSSQHQDAAVPYTKLSVVSYLKLSSCCFCISLRTGCFILGYMNLFFNAFQTLALLAIGIFIGVTGDVVKIVHKDPKATDSPSFMTVDSLAMTPVMTSNRNYHYLVGIPITLGLLVSVASLLLNICCLVGLHKKRLGPIKIYIAFTTGRLIIIIGVFVYLFCIVTESQACVLSHIIDVVVSGYFILVYYSYAKELEEERRSASNSSLDVPTDIAYIYPTKGEKQMIGV